MQTTTTIRTKTILKKSQTDEPEPLGAETGEELFAAASPIAKEDSSGKAWAESDVWPRDAPAEGSSSAAAKPAKREIAQKNANAIFENFNVSPTQKSGSPAAVF